MDTQTILKRLKIIDELSQEMNVIKDQYDDAMTSDPEYQRAEEDVAKAKDEIKEKMQSAKDKVLSRQSVKALLDEIKDRKEEIKQHKEILAQELADYYKDTGSLEVEDAEGNVKKVKFSVKLVS